MIHPQVFEQNQKPPIVAPTTFIGHSRFGGLACAACNKQTSSLSDNTIFFVFSFYTPMSSETLAEEEEEENGFCQTVAAWMENPRSCFFLFATETGTVSSEGSESNTANIRMLVIGSAKPGVLSINTLFSICHTFQNLLYLEIGQNYHLGRENDNCDNSVLDEIALSLPHLQHLRIGRENDIGVRGAEKIATMRNLQSLEIDSRNWITSDGLSAFCLLTNLRRLRVGYRNEIDETCEVIPHLFAQCQNLCCLCLTLPFMNHTTKRYLERFCTCQDFFRSGTRFYLDILRSLETEENRE